jgi:Cu+-exporting ATPase
MLTLPDLLVTLSTTTSYFASIAMLIIDVLSSPSTESIGTYFDSSVFLIMFILLGRTLEAYAKSRTTDAISLLGSLRPETALLVEPPSVSAITRKDAGRSSSTIFAQESPPIGEIEEKEGSAATESSMTPAYPSGPREVPVDHLERGDLILVPPGALPPTDGIVVAGSTTFDESSLTGESRPIRKSPGDEIFTGTTNLSGAITLKVTTLGGETMLSKIISAVSDASARKAPIEKLAERLTGVFVPIIVYLSLIVLAIWLGVALTGHVDEGDQVGGGRVFFAIEFAIAVLVVACPCGIGLAVPCANAVGNGIAARAGILASGGGEAFVAATRVGTVAFDKTGTLTIGKSVVTDEIYASGGQETKIDRMTVTAVIKEVEGGSTHPLAKGLVEYLAASSSGDKPPVVQIVSSDEIAGRGVSADVKLPNGTTIQVLIGNLALMHQHGVTIDPAHLTLLDAWSGEAKSVVLVSLRAADSQDFSLRVMYALSDPPREETKDVIADLRKRGMRVIMLSGDNGQTANAVAKMVGIRQEEVWAGVGPEGKAQVIRDLQRERPQPQTPTLVSRLRKAIGGDKDADRQLVMFVGGELAHFAARCRISHDHR